MGKKRNRFDAWEDGELSRLFMSVSQGYEASAKAALKATKARIELLEKWRDQISELTYAAGLIEADVVNAIKNNIADSCFNVFYGLTSDFAWKAWKKSSNAGEYEDEVDEKACESCLEYAKKLVFDKLLGGDKRYAFKEISMYNYGEGYFYRYAVNGKDVEVYVPLLCAATEKNYESMLLGYRLNKRSGEGSWDNVFSSLNPSEVVEAAKKLADELSEEK